MKIQHPFLSSFAHGTLSKLLIYRPAGRAHTVYRHFRPKQPNTTAQKNHHVLFGLLAARWPTFTRTEQDYWQPAARSDNITPYNAFLKYNLRRLNPAVPTGLTAWWPNIIPQGNTLHDLTANAYDGELVGTPANSPWAYASARRGQVLQFDAQHYFNVPSPPSLTAPFTVAYWFQRHKDVPRGAIIDTGRYDHYTAGYSLANYHYFMVHGTITRFAQLFPAPTAWFHIANVWTGTEQIVYVNGSHDKTTVSETAPDAQTELWIGRYGIQDPDYNWTGRLDDLRLYNRPIEPSEILELASR